MLQDIKDISDIKILVDSFYGKIRHDALIGDLFNSKIQDWNLHLEKMYRFWQTVLLHEHTYQGSPFPVHAPMSIAKTHFDRWKYLWEETINEHFAGTVADEAKWRGERMAAMFLSKIEYYQNNSAKPLL